MMFQKYNSYIPLGRRGVSYKDSTKRNVLEKLMSNGKCLSEIKASPA